MISGALPWDRSSFCLWHTENSLLLSRLSVKPHMSFSIEFPLSQNQFHFCCECHMWIQRRLVIARSSIAGECQKSMLAESPLKAFIFKWIGLAHQKICRRHLIVKKNWQLQVNFSMLVWELHSKAILIFLCFNEYLTKQETEINMFCLLICSTFFNHEADLKLLL